MQSSDLVNHLYDYRPNWTPLSLITIINTAFICLVNHLFTCVPHINLTELSPLPYLSKASLAACITSG